MTSACDTFREQLLELAGDPSARLAAAAAHLGDCPDCRARLERWQGQAQALRRVERRRAPAILDEVVAGSLTDAGRGVRAAAALARVEPVAAPAELEGRVVAALFSGHRQDRAVQQVKSLPRVDAPRVLRRRVEEVAPGELALVVAEDPSPAAPVSASSRARRSLSALALAAAAAVLVWLSPIWSRVPSPPDVVHEERLSLSFEVVHDEDSPFADDELARSVASAVMGGYAEVLR